MTGILLLLVFLNSGLTFGKEIHSQSKLRNAITSKHEVHEELRELQEVGYNGIYFISIALLIFLHIF